MTTLEFAIVVIAMALIFDFVNGWHDSANSIATVVATRVLSPRAAVLWAAFFNFIAFLVFGTFVAKTIGSDLIRISAIGREWQIWTLLCALIGATLWDIITWRYGLPSSSSHALIGGYAGAAIAAHHGVQGLLIAEGWIKTVAFIFVAPVLGLLLGGGVMLAVAWSCRRWRPARVDRTFRKLQLVSAALYSLGHGGNDAQKTMGIIAGVLVAADLDSSSGGPYPAVGRPCLSRCDGIRDTLWRMEDCANHGPPDHQAKAGRRVRGRDRGRGHPLSGDARRHSREHHTYDCGSHRRRWLAPDASPPCAGKWRRLLPGPGF